MNKFCFVKELARRLLITDAAAKAFVDEYNKLVIEKMCEGEEVKLSYYDIPERVTIKFKVSANVLDKLND